MKNQDMHWFGSFFSSADCPAWAFKMFSEKENILGEGWMITTSEERVSGIRVVGAHALWMAPRPKVVASSTFRGELTPTLMELASAGIVEIPRAVLAPRQILIEELGENIPCVLKEHRGSLIPTISRVVANDLWVEGKGTFLPQSLLSYTHAEYVADKDVASDPAEIARVEGYELVAVAIIGDNRSPLAVCRNIVSGCQKPESLVEDATGAMKASNIFLIED